MKCWVLYVLQCKDGSFYTGITDDLDHRLAQHRAGKGAKYTRGRSPLTLVYREQCQSHSDALKREYAIKQLKRSEKQKLIEDYIKTATE